MDVTYGDVQQIGQAVREHATHFERLLTEVRRVIVGQDDLLKKLLVGLLADGHLLLEGVPGLAKTTAVVTLARAIQASYRRIQFTPDLLPADIIGTQIFRPSDATFVVRHGPIIANFVLADEINRAPAKVQSALLEAMQERQITVGGETVALPQPFVVLATQNPIEQEGTYPLPEAQVDRFMLKIRVEYPSREEERVIMDRMSSREIPRASKVLAPADIARVRSVIEQVYVDEKIKEYIVNLVFATRDPAKAGLKDLADYIEYGGSPRATIYLNLAARAHAFLRHRGFVTPEDVKAVGLDVLRHRVSVTYEAEAEELTSEKLLQKIFDRIEVP